MHSVDCVPGNESSTETKVPSVDFSLLGTKSAISKVERRLQALVSL